MTPAWRINRDIRRSAEEYAKSHSPDVAELFRMDRRRRRQKIARAALMVLAAVLLASWVAS